jgi:hypothetical protein
MCQADITPRFDQSIVFPDIDAATLARESAMARSMGVSPWQDYLSKVLPPVPAARRQQRLRLVRS